MHGRSAINCVLNGIRTVGAIQGRQSNNSSTPEPPETSLGNHSLSENQADEDATRRGSTAAVGTSED